MKHMRSHTTTAPTALITGASHGLGRVLAIALADQGWRLLIDARGESELAAVAEELSSRTTVHAVAGDVNDPEHRAELAAAAEALGGLDAVVNNAGALGPSPLPAMLDLAPQDFTHLLNTNVVAPLAVLQALAPHMHDGARVLNLISDAASPVWPGWEGWGGYGASKAALERWTAVLAAERPDWRVYAVDPGDMRTPMHQAAFPGEDISDRPMPEASLPGLLRLLAGMLPSGRYEARVLAAWPEAERSSVGYADGSDPSDADDRTDGNDPVAEPADEAAMAVHA